MKKGIIKYIFMYDWVSGCNVPQMNWAQTANHGVVPNVHLPNTFFAVSQPPVNPT